MGLEKGFVQVYTGDGKGKTTAALGLAMRAVGHGLRVVMIQFLKDERGTGELAAAQHLGPLLTIKPMGRPGFIGPNGPQPGDFDLASAAMKEAEKMLSEKGCDVLILDEINVAVHLGLVSETALLALVARKPPDMELVLTGRGATQKLLEKADLVTTMQATKHYFDTGQEARQGIEG